MIKNIKILSSATIFIAAILSSANIEAALPLGDQLILNSLISQDSTKLSRGLEHITTLTGFVQLKNRTMLNEIESRGAEIINNIGDIYIVSMPIDSIESIANSSSVKRIELARKVKPLLNKARPTSAVDSVHQGLDLTYNGVELTQGFQGKDVFVAIFDTGLDPNNPNFGDRVEVVYYYPGSSASDMTVEEYLGENVKNFTTDTEDETHGTHVLGILTGSAATIDQCFTYDVRETPSGNQFVINILTNKPNPYNGVAPEARVGIGCASDLYNSFIVDGVEQLVEYGKSLNLPTIISLSLGGTTGPHDGTSLTSQALANLGQDANIYIAAGNEADEDLALTKEFSSNSELKTFFVPSSTNNRFDGSNDDPVYVEVWGNDNTVLDVNFVIVSSTGNILESYPITGRYQTVDLSKDASSYFSQGKIQLQYEIDATNNRYVAYIASNGAIKQKAAAYLGVVINGKAGQRADIFASQFGDISFSGRNMSGWTSPNGDMSINDMACGDNVIVIGAMNSRELVPLLESKITIEENNTAVALPIYQYFDLGEIMPFSSYGTLINGKSLPDFSAPGIMVSSLNYYYTKNQSESTILDNYSGELNYNGMDYYWGYEMGTSMATPFAAGIGALWQEANIMAKGKSLTTNEIIDIANRNNVRTPQYWGENKIQWGSGLINAWNGIRYILTGVDGIGKIFTDSDDVDRSFMLTMHGKEINIFVAGASGMNIELINLTGQKVYSRNIGTNNHTQSLQHLANGIYLIKVITPEGGHFTKKINLH